MASTRTWVVGRLLGGTHLLFDSLNGNYRSRSLLCLQSPIGSGPLSLLQLGRVVKVLRLRLVPNNLILQAEAMLSSEELLQSPGVGRLDDLSMLSSVWHQQQDLKGAWLNGQLLMDGTTVIPSERDAMDWSLGRELIRGLPGQQIHQAPPKEVLDTGPSCNAACCHGSHLEQVAVWSPYRP